MASNAIVFAWNRPIPGRERLSQAHFEDFSGYLAGLQRGGDIQSFDTVILDAHGGDMNGFFLIRGEPARLDSVMASEDWQTHLTRATLHLLGAGAVRAVTGTEVGSCMARWGRLLPE